MPLSISKPSTARAACSGHFDLVTVGLSSGGVDLLLQLLPELPADFPVPILVCMHGSGATIASLVELLDERSALCVREAEDKLLPQPGCAYLAPGGYHLHVERDGSCSLSLDAPEKYARPSVNVLFESAARCWRERLLAVLLSGANDDGAEGVRRVRASGGCIVVQDPEDAQVADMPRAAIAAAAPDHLVRAHELPSLLQRLCSLERTP